MSKTQRYALENTRYGMTEWKQKELERFCNGTKAKVFVYTVDHRTIERSLKEKNKEVSRLKREGEISFLEEKEWKKFWGKEYYRGIGEEWFLCLKELSLQIKNGIGSFENRKNKFFTFEEGCRQTPGSEKGERRIYMFGPCIVGGAYCKERLVNSARTADPRIFVESIFPGAFGTAAMESYMESQESYTALFEDKAKYDAIMNALAGVIYREMRQNTEA